MTNPSYTGLVSWAHYYIKGQAAKVSLGVDSVSLNSEAKNNDPNTSRMQIAKTSPTSPSNSKPNSKC
jgi:hypothetical protein